MKYTYYPDRNEFVFPATTVHEMLRRVTAPKDKIEEQDARENARRILMSAP